MLLILNKKETLLSVFFRKKKKVVMDKTQERFNNLRQGAVWFDVDNFINHITAHSNDFADYPITVIAKDEKIKRAVHKLVLDNHEKLGWVTRYDSDIIATQNITIHFLVLTATNMKGLGTELGYRLWIITDDLDSKNFKDLVCETVIPLVEMSPSLCIYFCQF
jgi:hypothetical protein